MDGNSLTIMSLTSYADTVDVNITKLLARSLLFANENNFLKVSVW